MLDKSGYDIRTANGQMKIIKGSLTVLKANMRNEIYILDGKTAVGSVVVANEDISRL